MFGIFQSCACFLSKINMKAIWPECTHEKFDAVILYNGFRPSLKHLASLNIIEADGKIQTNASHSIKEAKLWLVGYGDLKGYASAKLIGVSRTARDTAKEIEKFLENCNC